MNISKVKYYPLKKPKAGASDILLGYASLVFDDQLMIHNVKVLEDIKTKNIFLEMPKHKLPDGSLKDIFHPVDNNFRAYLKREIMGVMSNA